MADTDDDTARQMMLVSAAFTDAYRKEFRAFGPRHRNVDRWRYELGWNVPNSVVNAYLAPEEPRSAHYG